MNYLPHDHLTAVDDGAWPLAYEYDLQDRFITEQQGWATPALSVQCPRQLSQERRGAGQRHYHYDAFGRRI